MCTTPWGARTRWGCESLAVTVQGIGGLRGLELLQAVGLALRSVHSVTRVQAQTGCSWASLPGPARHLHLRNRQAFSISDRRLLPLLRGLGTIGFVTGALRCRQAPDPSACHRGANLGCFSTSHSRQPSCAAQPVPVPMLQSSWQQPPNPSQARGVSGRSSGAQLQKRRASGGKAALLRNCSPALRPRCCSQTQDPTARQEPLHRRSTPAAPSRDDLPPRQLTREAA